MGPNDGGGFCECEKCRALDGGDYDPFSHEPSVTDRYIWFFNQVLEKLGPEHKDVKLAFYIYHAYMRPPVRWKPDPRIMGALAPIALDRVHGFSNPIAPEKSYAKWLLQEWCKLMPEVYDRGYWSNLACPGFPFIIVHRLRDEIPQRATQLEIACLRLARRDVPQLWPATAFDVYRRQTDVERACRCRCADGGF